MTSPGHLFILLVLCLGLAATRVRADDEERALRHIEEGKRFLKEENYGGAMEAFKSSYALRPKAWLLFNIGMCQKALHRYSDAIATFNLYLSLEKKTEKANFRTLELAVQAIDELEKLVGKVRIVEAPDGAEISIDGVFAASAPLKKPLAMDPGRHALKISKSGFQDLDIDVIVASGAEVEVRASLERPKAEIRVECEGQDTRVLIDNVEVGRCPYTGKVEPGSHSVKVAAPRMAPFENIVDARAGGTIVMAVELKPEKEPGPPTFMDKPPPGQDEPVRKPRWMMAAGIASASLGVALLTVGGVMTHRWNEQYDVVAEAADETDAAYAPYDEEGWSELNGRWKSEADTADRYRATSIAGYAAGGGLVLIGSALLLVDLLARPKETSVALRHCPNGLHLVF